MSPEDKRPGGQNKDKLWKQRVLNPGLFRSGFFWDGKVVEEHAGSSLPGAFSAWESLFIHAVAVVEH